LNVESILKKMNKEVVTLRFNYLEYIVFM